MSLSLINFSNHKKGTDDHELIRANKLVDFEFHNPEWANISEEAKDWIKNALSVKNRFTPMQSALHPWLKGV